MNIKNKKIFFTLKENCYICINNIKSLRWDKTPENAENDLFLSNEEI